MKRLFIIALLIAGCASQQKPVYTTPVDTTDYSEIIADKDRQIVSLQNSVSYLERANAHYLKALKTLIGN